MQKHSVIEKLIALQQKANEVRLFAQRIEYAVTVDDCGEEAARTHSRTLCSRIDELNALGKTLFEET